MGTIRVRGTGGLEFDIDDPRGLARTLPRHEVLLEQLAKGDLVILSEDPTADGAPVVDEGHNVDQGAHVADSVPELAAGEPHRGASTAAWVEFAISKGADPGDLEDLKRDELVARFGTPQS